MIYKKLNKNIQEKVDNYVKIKHKTIFKNNIQIDLLAYHIKKIFELY